MLFVLESQEIKPLITRPLELSLARPPTPSIEYNILLWLSKFPLDEVCVKTRQEPRELTIAGGQRQVGDAYPLGALTQTQRDLAQDFVDLGLLFKRKAKSTRFYPTSIAVNLIFGSSPAGGGPGGVGQRQPQSAGGAIVVREGGWGGGRQWEGNGGA